LKKKKFICILCVRVHTAIFACAQSGYKRSKMPIQACYEMHI